MGYETFLNAQRASQQRYQAGAEHLERQRQRNALQSASEAYQTGGIDGARNALLQGGMLNDALRVEEIGRDRQAQDVQTQQANEDRAQAQRQRQQAALVAGAQGLRRLPADQRWPAYQTRVLPMLRQEGLQGEVLAAITEQVMDDASLDSVITMGGGQVEQPRYLQGSRGALDRVDPYSGAVTNVRQPERESAPSGYRWGATGGLEPIPGGPADPKVAGSLAASRRAPRTGRTSGGSGTAPSRSYSSSGIRWD